MVREVPRIRVLLIDDDEDDVYLARAMFDEVVDFRAEVVAAGSLEQGFRLLGESRFDICLVDYRIGPDSGIAFIEQVARSDSRVPVILLTGQGSREVDLRAMEAGAADYLVKGGLDAERLGRTVRYALDRAEDVRLIEASEARYRLLFESNPMPMWVCDNETLAFLAVNQATVDHYGYSREEFARMDSTHLRPAEDVPAFLAGVRASLPGPYRRGPVRHIRRDGSIIWVEITAHDIRFEDRPARLVLINDVTAKRAAEAEARLLARAFESSKSGMLIADARAPDLPTVYVNPAFVRMTGYEAADILGRNCRFMQGEDRDQEALRTVRETLVKQGECEVVLRNYRRDGSLFWNQLTLAPVRDADGQVTHYIGVSTDLTDRRRHEAELAYLARHDQVTGLPRFIDPEDALRPLFEEAAAADEQVALWCIDIDRFQSVNESVGYRGGDEVLRLLASRIRYVTGAAGKLWRLTSDEFVLALRFRRGECEPLAIAEQIRETLEVPVPVAGSQLFLSGTIGVAVHPDNARDPVELFQCSESAMYRSKRGGRNSVLASSASHAEELRERLALGSRLKSAILANEFLLYFQPQVNGSDGRITGMEALVRWRTVDRGLIEPLRFIQVAEELGSIVDLGRWVLHEACQQGRRWLDMGHTELRIGVNVSALQLHRISFVDEVREALERSGLPAHMLELETTESAIVENLARSLDVLSKLKALGVQLALDDFGLGYSCLSQLKRFPVDRLKIDQSFVRDVALAGSEAAIARAITAMGHELHLKVIAEGVETEAQFGYLLRNHCDEFQGFLFSPPLPVDEATALLAKRYVAPMVMSLARPERGLLLVDDEENVLRALVRVLRRDGYVIHTATNATEGFELLAKNRVQVIVSDQRMPGISGTQFLSRVKEMYPDTMRIVLSGYTDLATLTDAINRGAIYKFLTKPWDDEDLREQVRDAYRQYDERAARESTS
ncbi:EAL domain-containing protein [Aquimonas voraii]|uniref:cyclic-guanylate-specific phosphodiesterase n=1 Tax=Aquimonas voraii TaxID=265719 RepID=A0A1G6YCE6_9GAMM|nr:EAL domain-containing protein [Aquimonas voraii]SDD88010.1 PAS domain S-box-containing protein/diguanylate cyclase (GGDEF) domain-containing protein [Aquimonas voraii]